MQNVEEAVYDTYLKNMEYIQLNHPQLAKDLTFFNTAVDNGDYKTAFELEFKDGYFDIIELASQRYLYGEDSLEISKELVKGVNFSKKHFVFEAVPLMNYSQEITDTITELPAIPKLSLYSREYEISTKEMKEVEKFILIGVGLGLHIPYIHNSLYPKSYMIIEDDIEIFKLSLFTTKYYELASAAKLEFAISQDDAQFYENFTSYIDTDYIYNRFIKYYQFPNHSDEKITQIKKILVGQNFIAYGYKPSLRKILAPLDYLNDGYMSLDLFTKKIYNGAISKHPILVLAAGPSFQKNIEWIKKAQSQFFIIAPSAVLPTLYKENIQADIITHIDSSDITLKFYDNIPEEFYAHTMMLFSSQISSNLRTKFPKDKVFFLEDNHSYYKKIGILSTPCVGSISLALALALGSKSIYVLGLDLAFDQKTGSTHYSGHFNAKKQDLNKENANKYQITMSEDILELEGNFTPLVYTNPLLAYSTMILNKLVPKIIQKDQVVYNLSDGVKIQNVIALAIEDVKIQELVTIDKAAQYEVNHHSLISSSFEKLSQDDIKSMQQTAYETKEIQKIIDVYCAASPASSYKKYFYQLLEVIKQISTINITQSNQSLISIYDDFAKFILAIIYDFFNTKNLQDEEKNIQYIDSIIKNELNEINTTYLNKVNKFLKEKI